MSAYGKKHKNRDKENTFRICSKSHWGGGSLSFSVYNHGVAASVHANAIINGEGHMVPACSLPSKSSSVSSMTCTRAGISEHGMR